MKRISLSILFAFLPLLLWGQGLNDGTFDPTNPDDPHADRPDPKFSVEVLLNRAKFTVINSDPKNVTYEWTLDDRVVGTGPEILCSSLTSGEHTVSLTARNMFGSNSDKTSFTIDSEENWGFEGNFTFNSQITSLRNFKTADEMFDLMIRMPWHNNPTVRFESACDATDYLIEHSDLWDKLKERAQTYGSPVHFYCYSTQHYLKLWDEWSKDYFQQFLQVNNSVIMFDVPVYIGEVCLNRYSSLGLTQYLRSNQEYSLAVSQISNLLTFSWRLTNAESCLSTGYIESGTKDMNFRFTNSSTELDYLYYEIDVLYNGEIIDTQHKLFCVYPESIVVLNPQPADNGLIPNVEQVTFSWDYSWWVDSAPFDSYLTLELWKDGEEDQKYTKQSLRRNPVTIAQSAYPFKRETTYHWRIKLRLSYDSFIYSPTYTFTISNVPDLQVTSLVLSKSCVKPQDELILTATVTNVGSLSTDLTSWNDYWYECLPGEDGSYTQFNQLKIDSHLDRQLAVGESYEVSCAISIPFDDRESLRYRLVVNGDKSFVEGGYKNNLQEVDVPFTPVKIQTEDLALLKELYDQTDGENWTIEPKWDLTKETIGRMDFNGVGFDAEGHVISIALSHIGLKGEIPPSLFTMSYLQSLDLSYNQMTNVVDHLFDSVETSPLQTVNLSHNQLTGTLPTAVKKLTELSNLDLSYNRISDIESWLGLPLTITNQSLKQKQPLTLPLSQALPGVITYSAAETPFRPTLELYDEGKKYCGRMRYSESASGYVILDSLFLTMPTQAKRIAIPQSGAAEGTELTFTFSYPMGDANMDNRVTIQDLQHELNYIFGQIVNQGYAVFNFAAANTFADEQINVQDMVTTTNIILDTPLEMRSAVQLRSLSGEDTENRLYIEHDTLYLKVTEPVTAVDVTMKEVKCEQISYLLNADRSMFTMKDTERGARFIIQFLTGDIPVGTTPLVTLTSSKEMPIICAAMIANAQAKEVPVYFEGRENWVTGIEIFQTDNLQWPMAYQSGSYAIYDLTGRCVKSRQFSVPGQLEWQELTASLVSGNYILSLQLMTREGSINKQVKFNIVK